MGIFQTTKPPSAIPADSPVRNSGYARGLILLTKHPSVGYNSVMRIPTDHDKAKKHEWYLAHKNECIVRTLQWRKDNPDARRKHRRTARGVLNATGEKKLGVCEFCLRIMQLQQDHDHITGKARGWLCSRCNLLVGWWEIIQREEQSTHVDSYIKRWE